MSFVATASLPDCSAILERYDLVRRTTEQLCQPLAIEDYVVQGMPDVSPTKWHLAHVSWFFDTFLLEPHLPGYVPRHAGYRELFNSYYHAVGPQFSRPERGHLSRPTVAEILVYRAWVDAGMTALFDGADERTVARLMPLLELGLAHEQQHQELIITDIKYNLAVNPLRPAYHDAVPVRGTTTPTLGWLRYSGGLVWVGHDGPGFAFDNEAPRHRAYLRPFRLADRPVTNGEYLAFIEAGGYDIPTLWLSEGWRAVQERGWRAPLYWERGHNGWQVQTLAGLLPLDAHAPVAHVSYFEADAYARWRSVRLPTEQEWEHAAAGLPIAGHFQDRGIFQPLPAPGGDERPVQMFGDVWEWTRSAYAPYPGFQPAPGAVGEYNGKFMVGQMVLRGGSCASPRSHLRASYRNFFPPDARWQFSGIRLADEA